MTISQTLLNHVKNLTGRELKNASTNLIGISTIDPESNPNTECIFEVTAEGISPFKVTYRIHRDIFHADRIPADLTYEDEEDLLSDYVIILNERYKVNLQAEELPQGKIKSFLDDHSPLGHVTITVENLELSFKKTFRLAPHRLDVKYLFNEIVTLDEVNQIIFVDERIKEEPTQPAWEIMKEIIESLNLEEDPTHSITEGNQDGIGNPDGEDRREG